MQDFDGILEEYQNAQIKINVNIPLEACNLKRRCLILKQLYSYQRYGNNATCHLLEKDLRDYFDLVDDGNKINNFLESTQGIVSNIKTDMASWKGNLCTDGPSLNELLQDLPGECYNKTENNGCSSNLPTEQELKTFFTEIKPQIVQREIPAESQVTGLYNPPFPCKRPKLYSTYEEKQQNVTQSKPSNSGSFPKRPEITNGRDNFRSSYNHNKSKPYANKQQETEENSSQRSGIYFSRVGGTFKKWNLGKDRSQEDSPPPPRPEELFKTAGEQLKIESHKKFGNNNGRENRDQYQRESKGPFQRDSGYTSYHPTNVIKKSLGGKRSIANKFVPPFKNNSQEESHSNGNSTTSDNSQEEVDERLKGIDPKMIELIKNDIMDQKSLIGWDDIAGLQFAKTTIQEIVVWPMLRPDIFTGLRRPPKGILLFGPPGTGKTLIGKCIASQSNSTFFSISASSLTSKWIGEGEKMVRALFAVARVEQPAVVFIDEIDSLLSQRSDTEHESSRRLKTEFLVQLDGAATGEEDKILVIGATNRPQELDEAARRRLVKRLYIPLPDFEARIQLVTNLLKNERNDLSDEDVKEVATLTEGYSGADIKNVCKDASLGPIRSLGPGLMFNISATEVRPMNVEDFKTSLKRVRSSVSPKDLEQYVIWDKTFGCGGMPF